MTIEISTYKSVYHYAVYIDNITYSQGSIQQFAVSFSVKLLKCFKILNCVSEYTDISKRVILNIFVPNLKSYINKAPKHTMRDVQRVPPKGHGS